MKIGLTLLPPEEMPNFQSALECIRAENHSIGVLFDWTVWQTFMPGAYRSDIVVAMVFRRKRDGINLPYAFLVLMYGNEMFQVFLPAPDRDQHIEDKPLMIYRFPGPLDLHPSDAGLPKSGPLSLTGTTVMKDDVVTVSLTYGQPLQTE